MDNYCIGPNARDNFLGFSRFEVFARFAKLSRFAMEVFDIDLIREMLNNVLIWML